MGTDLLTSLLTAFQAVLSLGMHNAGPATARLFMLLATLEIAGLGLWWIYSHDNAMGVVMFRVLTLAVFLWLMQDWQVIVGGVQESFMRLGLLVGGNQFTIGSIHSAGMNLIQKGQELSLAIQGKVANPTFFQSVDYALTAMAPTHMDMTRWVVSWAVLLAFYVAGIHVFAVQLEFVFCSAMAFITIPFAVWHRTAWVSERTFGAVVGSGLKLAFLYMLASASIPVLRQYVAPIAPSQQDSLSMLGAGGLILFLQWGAHKLASGIMHGMPSFTQSDVLPRIGPMMAIGAMAGGLATRAVSLGTTAARGLGVSIPRRRP